jgi:hypothetical protein
MRSLIHSAKETSNQGIYRQQFLRHIHHLLQMGYESLKPTDFTSSEENVITGEICKRIKELTEDAPTEVWMRHFSVHDQDPVNDGVDDAGKRRVGDRRPRLDIRLVSKRRVPNSKFCVEAKRLYRGDSVAAYADDEGLGAFISEYYAKADDAAGMLGYVQSESVEFWSPKLARKLTEECGALILETGNHWAKHTFKGGPEHTYRTRHRRVKSGRSIEVCHTLFLFC